ncbi:hypothetical protein ACWGE1_14425 [Streptomyces sp. NPDC054932]
MRLTLRLTERRIAAAAYADSIHTGRTLGNPTQGMTSDAPEAGHRSGAGASGRSFRSRPTRSPSPTRRALHLAGILIRT